MPNQSPQLRRWIHSEYLRDLLAGMRSMAYVRDLLAAMEPIREGPAVLAVSDAERAEWIREGREIYAATLKQLRSAPIPFANKAAEQSEPAIDPQKAVPAPKGVHTKKVSA